MVDNSLKARLTEAMKSAMRAQDKPRLGTIRLILAEIKQVEVDERIEPDATRLLAILDKMAKQRRDSISQFRSAGRDDLADLEAAELAVIGEFLPQPLSEAELGALVDQAIADTGASAIGDMGRVIGQLRPAVQGRADMGAVSALVKSRLSR
jgi:uncharacterized protein YqeY